MIRTYEDALAYLKSREKFGIKFGLANIDRLAEALGRPERQFPSVLIAGTNGKGSTAALLASILTKPRAIGPVATRHPTSVFSRSASRWTGAPLRATSSRRSSHESLRARASMLTEPTFFEAVTASAFAFLPSVMSTSRCSKSGWVAVGTRPTSLAAECIGDHPDRVRPRAIPRGDDRGDIASEKAAIIKQDRPVVVGKLAPEALAVVRDEAVRQNAELILAMR